MRPSDLSRSHREARAALAKSQRASNPNALRLSEIAELVRQKQLAAMNQGAR